MAQRHLVETAADDAQGDKATASDDPEMVSPGDTAKASDDPETRSAGDTATASDDMDLV